MPCSCHLHYNKNVTGWRGLDGAFMDLFRVDTHYIMTRRHYFPTREGDNVVRPQLMPQVSGKPHCSLYTRQPSRIIAIATVKRVCWNSAYLPLIFPWTAHSVLASSWLALPGRRSWSHETLLYTSGPSWEHVLGDKRGTCSTSRGVEVREEEKEGKRREEKGKKRKQRGRRGRERPITLVILYRASRPDSLLQSVKYKWCTYSYDQGRNGCGLPCCSKSHPFTTHMQVYDHQHVCTVTGNFSDTSCSCTYSSCWKEHPPY